MTRSHTVDPTREAFQAFKDLPRDTPLNMLNLIQLRDQAAYADKRQASGAEAYAEYGRRSGPIFERVGGTILWRGRPEVLLIGPADESWDLAFIAAYPSAGAFLEMVTDPTYQSDAVPHRVAAVVTSRLLRTLPIEGGSGFG